MFERFTDRARRVVVLAQEEARLLNHNYIGTEHLLLGLAHEGQGVAAGALESLGIRLEALRSQVEEIIGRGESEAASSGHIPFTPRAKTVLELSLRESQQLGHNYIGTEHILLGLIREGQGVAAQVLVKLGADFSRVRQVVIQLLSGSAGGPEAAAEPRPVHMPEELREVEEQLAEVRRQKVAAIEAQDFDRARALRDQELQLLERLAEREGEWRAGVDVAAVVQEYRRLYGEVQQLHGEVQRLRELLRQHGIEPDGGTTQPA
jgi:ATP-dependent Clp protease ATP-binding subunit ClpA